MYAQLFSGFRQSRSSVRKGRRPAGISRREKYRRRPDRQLSFEPLEDRRVLSADSGLVYLGNIAIDESQLQSYSSATAEGQAAILLNELYWQSLIENFTSRAESAVLSIPTDPLVANQWHLINTGQEVGSPDYQAIYGVPGEDINVAPVWNMGYTGEGVVVAVIDDGVQVEHPDLIDNISDTLALNAGTYAHDGGPIDITDNHGTAVAGLIGAVADNGIGGTGVAPGVTLVPIQYLSSQTENAAVNAFRYATDEIDITNNSWGPQASPGEIQRFLAGPTEEEILALRDSIIFGRDGLGIIHVFASGNSAENGYTAGSLPGVPIEVPGLDSSGYNGWINSRYTIGVTGVDHDGFYNNIDGTITAYPETSTSVLVAAPTGSNSFINHIADDDGLGSGLYTTDRTGEDGYNSSDNTGYHQVTPPTGDRDFLEDLDYTSRFNGTSASAPIVTGVIALMLEANPNLSWRDVQEILIRSARQNAEFDEPMNGYDQGQGIAGPPTTWIVNQMDVFHDPDPYDPTIDPNILIMNPTLDPTIYFDPNTVGEEGASTTDTIGYIEHYQPTPQVLTTAAGYTVSQGRGTYGEQLGYAHGVVDAEMAVLLAEQWHTKDQALPDELSFTTFVTSSGYEYEGTIPAAEKSSEDQLVPGGLGGEAGFIAYWNEFYADNPFSADDPPDNTRGGPISLTVPDSNTMRIETVEVKVVLSGGTADALDNLRVLLVSPNGTHSELNNFYVEPNEPFSLQNHPGYLYLTDGISADSTSGNMVWTFSTNRSWGERSDNAYIIDPTTGEPYLDPLAGLLSSDGILEQGWELHFENYGSTAFTLETLEVAWHGSPIGADTYRIQGLVGVDDNQDDLFNYSRVIQQFRNIDDDPNTLRYDEVQNVIDETHESMGANVTVFAHLDVNGNGMLDASDTLVDQFVTGADGNYYFDLVPDNYIISVEDSEGRTAVDDSTTPSGFLKDYQAQWNITTDYFKLWDYDANLDVPLDPTTDAPYTWTDDPGGATATPYHVSNINFLLDPGSPATLEVDFSGTVYADTNGDGLFNSDDVAVPGITVYGDVNRNGSFDPGEANVQTDANGQYNLIVPTEITTVMNVGVELPVDWTASDPSSGLVDFFVEPGDAFTDVDFHIDPPAYSGGDGSDQPGYLMGVVFEDVTNDSIRQVSENGVPNLRVYIDVNNSGAFDAGDVEAITNQHGAYAFGNVPEGTHILRVDIASPIQQTLPIFNQPITITLLGSGTVAGLDFGVRDTATLDYGDLPVAYGVTTLAEDGARHPKGNFYLGSLIDGELNGQPSANADMDDNTGFADEDGIVIDPITKTVTTLGRLEATASRHGGYLQGWMDFNGDNDFDDVIDGVSERIITNVLLDAGYNEVFFDVPTTIDASTIYARFRYGEYGIDSLTGLAQIGEVEDYAIVPTVVAPLIVHHGADFDGDGDVDGRDLMAWMRGKGKTEDVTPADGDANGDGAVDATDLDEWRNDYGTGTSTAPLVSETGDFDADGDVDGSDLLAWQRGRNIVKGAMVSDGDANADGAVNTSDLDIWQDLYGMDQTSSAASSSAASTSANMSEPVIVVEPMAVEPMVVEPTVEASELVVVTESTADSSVPSVVSEPIVATATVAVSSNIDLGIARQFTDESALSLMQSGGLASKFAWHHGHQLRSHLFDDADVEKMDRGSSHLGMALGMALRDRALADLFTDAQPDDDMMPMARGKRMREMAKLEEEQEAVLAAFDEEIDWRL